MVWSLVLVVAVVTIAVVAVIWAVRLLPAGTELEGSFRLLKVADAMLKVRRPGEQAGDDDQVAVPPERRAIGPGDG
jgi:hypothetical protein